MALKTAVLKAKATDLERNADEDWMRELRTQLMIKEGEVIREVPVEKVIEVSSVVEKLVVIEVENAGKTAARKQRT